MVRIQSHRRRDRDDFTRRVHAEIRRVHAVVNAVGSRIFAHPEKIRVGQIICGKRPAGDGKIHKVRVVGKAALEDLHQVVAAHVIQDFLAGTVGKTVHGKMSLWRCHDFKGGEVCRIEISRFGKKFCAVIQIEGGICRFIRIIERAVRGDVQAVVGRVAILHQMIPADKDDPAKTVHARREGAAGRVVEQMKFARSPD